MNESEEISFSHYFHYSVLVSSIQPTQQTQQSTETVADDEVSTQQSPSANQTVEHRSAMSLSELSKSQKKSLRMNIAGFDYKQKIIDRVTQDIRIVDNAVKASAKNYISSFEMMLTTREILQSLSNRYIRERPQLVDQLIERYQSLKQSSIKDKIES